VILIDNKEFKKILILDVQLIEDRRIGNFPYLFLVEECPNSAETKIHARTSLFTKNTKKKYIYIYIVYILIEGHAVAEWLRR
jgi:hypothetical protein